MKPAALGTGAAGQPRYMLVAQALIDDINRGHYAVGELLPTEAQLCEQFNVSRHTVREALRRLSELGLVTRQAGVGTRLKAHQTVSKYVQTSDGINDLYNFVRDVRLIIHRTERRVADRALANLLGCQEGQAWTHLEGERFIDKEKIPIALTDVYLALPYGNIIRDTLDPSVPIYSVLEKTFGIRIVEIQQTTSAVEIDQNAARRLSVKRGSAGLQVLRRYYAADHELVEVSVSLHPGSRFTYSTTQRLVS